MAQYSNITILERLSYNHSLVKHLADFQVDKIKYFITHTLTISNKTQKQP